VVELRVRPVAGVVALLAGLREIRSNVIGIGRTLEVLQVAGHAGSAAQVVVIVDVAVGAGAWRHRVQTVERKPSTVVVELRVHPVAAVVALLAGLREVRSNVIWVRSSLEVFHVARHARFSGQIVVIVNVAVGTGAWRHRVQAGERKSSAVVIELRVSPVAGVVALLAGLREVRSRMIGIGRPLEVLQVAAHARRTVQCVVIVDVAIRALTRRNGVQSSQHEAGHRMIELGIAPLHCIVAGFARIREPGMRHRSGRAGEIFLVAAETRHRTQGVIVVDMAFGALPRWNRVSSGQNKTSRAVVEPGNFGVQPVVCRVTGLASGRELRFHVARVGGRGEVLQVA